MKLFSNNQKGFTLVEVLISVVILVAVIGAITALERSHIITGSSSKFNIQANGVGQEGVNLVKAISDKVSLDTTAVLEADKCTDPNDSDKCESGVYYLNGSNELIKCVSCKNEAGGNQACPTVDLSTTKLLCNDPSNLPSTINGKVFTRTIIVP